MKNSYFIGLGSNIGEREENLTKAKKQIKKLGIKIIKESKIYETEPMYYKNQGKFLNQVIKIKTEYEPDELLKNFLIIEKELKRERKIKNGPRTIDIDILFFENNIIRKTDLIIPHPKIIERDFVLSPMCEIAGDFIHPEYNKTMCELMKELTEEKNKPKFICDAMLGDIAEWLRLMGFFVYYNPDKNDNELIKISLKDGYIILTRDKELSERKNIKAYYIKSSDFIQTIKELFLKFDVSVDKINLFSRCPLCGEKLYKTDKREIKLFVPQRIYEEYEDFYSCKKCEKIYWKGEKYKNLYNQYLIIKKSLIGNSAITMKNE